MKGVIIPFSEALLRLLERRYYAFPLPIITAFLKALLCLSKRRYYAYIYISLEKLDSKALEVLSDIFP